MKMRPTEQTRKQASAVTLKTLASHLGLNPATVSVVLNDVPGRSIPENTRARIKAAAREFGYSPNVLARSLRTKITRTVGVVLPDVTSDYHAQILSGAASHLAQFGYCCMISPHSYDASLVLPYMEAMKKRGAEGFILIDTAIDSMPSALTVAVGCPSYPPGTTTIELDPKRTAFLALEFVLSQGHRDLLLLRGDRHNASSDRLLSAISEIAAAYGLRVAEQQTSHSPSSERPQAILALDTDSATMAKHILSTGERCANRNACIVSIDSEKHSAPDETITVIRQPLRAMGQIAAEVLMQKIVGNRPVSEQITVEPEVVRSASAYSVATSRLS